MPAPVTFNLTLAPLPENFSGTPQELATAIVDRLTVAPQEPWSSFQNGGSIPISDVGPVLYQGVEWRVFDIGLGSYTYLRVHGAGIIAGTVPFSALKTEVGKANSISAYDGSGVPTVIEPGDDGQTIKMVDGAPTWADPDTSYPARANTASTQNVSVTGLAVDLTLFTSVAIDPDSAYSSDKYVAPVDGVYQVSASLQVDNSTADAAGMTTVLRVVRNGSAEVLSGGAAVGNPPGSRWFLQTSGLVELTAGDFIRPALYCDDGTLSGVVVASNGQFSVHLVKAL